MVRWGLRFLCVFTSKKNAVVLSKSWSAEVNNPVCASTMQIVFWENGVAPCRHQVWRSKSGTVGGGGGERIPSPARLVVASAINHAIVTCETWCLGVVFRLIVNASVSILQDVAFRLHEEHNSSVHTKKNSSAGA